MKRTRLEIAALAAVVVLAAGATYVNLAPGGAIRSQYDTFVRERKLRSVLKKNWDSILVLSSPLGSAQRERAIIEVTDYQCPFCAEFERALQESPKVRSQIRVLHFPLPGHRYADEAAAVASCAGQQDLFVPVHRALFSDQSWAVNGDFSILARSFHLLDNAEFQTCLGSDATKSRIAASVALAKELGVVATPTFITRRTVKRGLTSPDSVGLLALK